MCAGVACTSPRVTSSARERDPDVGAEVAVASRKVGACVDRRAVTRFQVAHFNDLQARYSDRIDGKSRYGYLAGYLRALKAEEPRTLVLDAGDDYEKGAVAELRSMGESTRQMIQALPIDARTLGNHDFAYGEAAVLRDVTRSAHPVLSSNMAYEGAGRPPFASIARFDVGCVRVGVIGLTTHNFGADDQPSREPFAGVFRPDLRYVEVARALVARVRDRVDVLVSLDHIGLEADLELARRVPGIDLIVGGHSEDLLAEPRAIVRDDGSRAWVVQAGRWGRTLGKLELSFDPATRALAVEGYRIVDVNATLPYAVDVGELAEGLERQSAPDAHEVIGQVNREVPEGEPMSRLVYRAVRERWGADALLVGRDVFWERLRPGPLTLQALYETVLVEKQPAGTPGFTSLYVVSMSGRELSAMRARLAGGSPFAFFGPTAIAPERRYRVVVEKRVTVHPRLAFASGYGLPETFFGGEMIDVLESYARSRTAQGLPLL